MWDWKHRKSGDIQIWGERGKHSRSEVESARRMVKEMLFSLLTHGKPINTGKDCANVSCCSQGEQKFTIAGEESLWIAGAEVGAKDIWALESQAKEMILFCREWGLTKLESGLMKALLKADSKHQMKDELQRKAVEGEPSYSCHLCHAYYVPGIDWSKHFT